MDAIERIERHHRTMQQRFMGSIAAYGTFTVAAVLLASGGRLQEDLSMLVLVVLLVGSLLILPRSTAPPSWPRPQNAEDSDRLDMLREGLRQLQFQATLLRVVYLVVTAVVLLLLPRMLG